MKQELIVEIDESDLKAGREHTFTVESGEVSTFTIRCVNGGGDNFGKSIMDHPQVEAAQGSMNNEMNRHILNKGMNRHIPPIAYPDNGNCPLENDIDRLPPGQKRIYLALKRLGQGSYADIHKALKAKTNPASTRTQLDTLAKKGLVMRQGAMWMPT